MKYRIALALLLFCCGAALAGQPVSYACKGLEGYDIRGTFDVDWTWGEIRNKRENLVIGFSLGPMVAEAAPAVRPAGFRTYTIEHHGTAVIRSGLNVRDKQFLATVVGAPICKWRLNLVARPGDRRKLLEIARILVDAPCQRVVIKQ